MADIEAPLLQAARDLQAAEPDPALDAAILNAAAQRAQQIRQAQPLAAKTPKTPSMPERLSRWLFGDEQRRGHFRQALAAAIVAGIALGIVWQAVRAPGPPMPELAMMEPPPPPPFEIAPEEAPKEMAERRAMPSAGKRNAQTPATADSIAAKTQADQIQFAAPSPASPPPAATLGRARMMESESLPAAEAMPAPATQMEEAAQQRAGGVAAMAPLARTAAPSPAQEAEKAGEMKANAYANAEAEIETQLKRILDLRRAGKEEEAQELLRQLRARHPEGHIDERLRQREKEQSQQSASP